MYRLFLTDFQRLDNISQYSRTYDAYTRQIIRSGLMTQADYEEVSMKALSLFEYGQVIQKLPFISTDISISQACEFINQLKYTRVCCTHVSFFMPAFLRFCLIHLLYFAASGFGTWPYIGGHKI